MRNLWKISGSNFKKKIAWEVSRVITGEIRKGIFEGISLKSLQK